MIEPSDRFRRTRQRRLRSPALAGPRCGWCALWAPIASLFTVDVTEYGVVTRFGRVRARGPAPGLHCQGAVRQGVAGRPAAALLRPGRGRVSSREDKKNIVVESCRDVAHRRSRGAISRRSATARAAEVRLADIVLAEIGAGHRQLSVPRSFIATRRRRQSQYARWSGDPRPRPRASPQGLRHRGRGRGRSPPVPAGAEPASTCSSA